jgi:uncharacterized LabA/DUF88 family protein
VTASSFEATKARAAIFVDAANYFHALKRAGWRIDYARFLAYFRAMYDVRLAFYYDGVPSLGVFLDRNSGASAADFDLEKKKVLNYHKRLKQIGYTVRSKPVGRLYDRSVERSIHKCNFDVELAIDALGSIARYDVCILGSGDGDFDRLVRYLKGRHKSVVVVSHKSHLSDLLRPDRIVLLEGIRAAVEKTWVQP